MQPAVNPVAVLLNPFLSLEIDTEPIFHMSTLL